MTVLSDYDKLSTMPITHIELTPRELAYYKKIRPSITKALEVSDTKGLGDGSSSSLWFFDDTGKLLGIGHYKT